MATTEKIIENLILDWLKAKQIGLFWKNQSTGIYDPVKKTFRKSYNKHHLNGVSDILGIVNGKFIAIEVKTKRGRPTENQTNFLRRINENGGIAFIARSIEDVEDGLTGCIDLQ